MNKLNTGYYNKAIAELRKEIPEDEAIINAGSINTIFETYSWYKDGAQTFDEIANMLAFEKEVLKKWFDSIDRSPKLQKLFKAFAA
jgi:hypothetical protein